MKNHFTIFTLAVLLTLSLAAQSRFDSPMQGVRQAADQTVTSSTTMVNSSLSVPLETNKTYFFTIYLPFSLAGVVSGYKFDLSSPSGLANFSCTPMVYNGGSGTLLSAVPMASVSSLVNGALATTGDHYVEMKGNIEVGSTAGNFILRFAQNTSSASAITLKQGATMTVQEVR